MTGEPNRVARQRYRGPLPHGNRTIVRVGQLEQTLEGFKQEMGHDMARAFSHGMNQAFSVHEARIAALEWRTAPFWKKLLFWFANSKLGLWITERFDKPEPDENAENEGDLSESRTCAKCGQLFVVHNDSRICPVCELKQT